jgi:Raf kinase inhibitor-like YbhB/YbcL family protein
LCSACLWAGDGQKHALASDRTETQAARTIELTSPAFADGQAIPLRYSAYGDGIPPPLQWSAPPEGTASLVLFVEDPDASSHRPYLHWVAWNIPADSGGLPEDVRPEGLAGLLAHMVQGTNHRRRIGYFGPHPQGSKPHHYWFQIFALDRTLDFDPGASRSQVIAALDGHVLAKGRLLGLFGKP